jgi:hypothetical protein
VNLGGLEAQRGLHHGVEDVDARHDQQPHRPRLALGQRDDRRQQPPLVAGRPRRRGRIIRNVDADQPHGHRDDVTVARGAKRGVQVGQDAGLAHGHEDIAWARLDVRQVLVTRRQQLELVERAGRRFRLCRRGSLRDDEERRHAGQQRRAGE